MERNDREFCGLKMLKQGAMHYMEQWEQIKENQGNEMAQVSTLP